MSSWQLIFLQKQNEQWRVCKEIDSRRKIGIGPRRLGFKCGCDLRRGNGKYSKESIEQDLQ